MTALCRSGNPPSPHETLSRNVIASIIIPVYRQWELLARLIDCLTFQTVAASTFEVIVVDNDGRGPVQVSGLPENFSLVQCHKPGSYAARNAGMRAARGDWFVFTDADCLPQPDWLENLLDQNKAASVRAGRVIMVSPSGEPNIFERYDQVRGIPQDWYVRRGYAATANLAIRREDALTVGHFDEDLFSGGDADYVRRAVAKGIPLVYVPHAAVEHPARDSWQALTTKVRRMRGGQLTAGKQPGRLYWAMRSLIPPIVPLIRYTAKSDQSASDRLLACGIEVLLWAVGLVESLRLLLGGKPVRD